MANVTFRYGGDTVTHLETAVHVSCDDAESNDDAAYNSALYPASPEITYYFSAELSGQDSLVSQIFAPDGGHGEWHGIIFPAAGTWAVHLRKTADDSSVDSSDLVVA